MRIRSPLLAGLGAGVLLAVAAPLAAVAHVTITPDTAEPGGYTTVTVRVPNESATASTTRLELTLPSDTPISSVRYAPVPGWVVETRREKFEPAVELGGAEITEAITKITWTAEPGFEIADGEFQQFTVSLGPVPPVDSLLLSADQHYSDGSVVSWSEQGENAEHPAPVLYIAADPPSHHGGGASGDDQPDDGAGAGSDIPPGAGSAGTVSSPDVLARVLGVGGLVVGAIGLAFGVTARRRPAAA